MEKMLEKIFNGFNSPGDIQDFLDRTKYNPAKKTKSPLGVAKNLTSNCFEGALFAAAAFRYLGRNPLIIDMLPEKEKDDDHVIAVFMEQGHWGAVSKSNTPVLRYREPVYRSVRELVMSYFDVYFNTSGEKTLRKYSNPISMAAFDKMKFEDGKNWISTKSDIYLIGDMINRLPHRRILTENMKTGLRLVNKELLKAGFIGSVKSGLYSLKKTN